jgi:4,4'-diaponeurosporenoate glycosyltransferase
VIVVDDDSSDGTAGIAQREGARVLRSDPLPEGWRGKTWACSQGAGMASGDLLLFLDADTRFPSDSALEQILHTYSDRQGALSLAPYHAIEKPYEELSAFFNLMMHIGTGAFTVLGSRRPPSGLFGPFLLVDRGSYDLVGGHRTVKGAILENFELAKYFRAKNIPMRCYGGRGCVHMRMYPGGLGEMAAGWHKAFASGAAQTTPGLLGIAIAWVTGSLLACIGVSMACLHSPAACYAAWGAYALYAAQIMVWLKRIGSFSVLSAVFYPVPLLFWLAVFGWSAVSRWRKAEVVWKDRRIRS